METRYCVCREAARAASGGGHLLAHLASQMGTLAGVTFDSIEVTQAARDSRQVSLLTCLRAATDFARQPLGVLTIIGETGNGKSTLAAAVANELREVGRQVVFVVVPELWDLLRQASSPDAEYSFTDLFLALKGADVLILDDLRAEYSTNFVRDKLYQLIDARYRERPGRALMVTSNLTEASMQAEFPACYSRLKDRAWGRFLQNKAPDYRVSGSSHDGVA
jgi:DNA replication protein DnaC